MKITTLLLIFGLLPLTASVFSQRSFSFKVDNKSVREVLEQLEEQSQFRFFYNDNFVDLNKEISLEVTDAPMDEILDKLLSSSAVTYKILENNLIVIGPKLTLQQLKITGTITDANTGEAITGANIVIEGSGTGVVSDPEGKFSIEVPDQKAVLVISFIGYLPEKVIANQSSLNIRLIPDIKTLEEVVVTALGIKRNEKALGYAVQKVSGNTLTTVKGVDIATSLTGKVAGLLVLNSSEFAKEATIEIRGETPLLVIDGVPYDNMSLRDIAQDDIENLTVLKGATASALYGYRGASGAIMVTTKKGMANKGVSVAVNSGVMFTAGFLAIPEIQSTFGRVVNTSTNTYSTGGDGSWGVPMDGRTVIQWDPVSKSWQSMPYLPRGKDNFKNFQQPGFVLNNNISVTQQGENGNLRASATWVQNKGQYPNSMFNKYNFMIGGDMKLRKLTLSSTMSYSKQISPNIGFSGYTQYDPMYSMLIWSAPDWDVTQYKDYWLVPNEEQNSSYTDSYNNPYFDRYERLHSVDKDILNGTISLDYEFKPWLKATLRTGYDTYSNRQEIRISMGSLVSAGSATLTPYGSQVWGESQKGSYNIGLSRGYSFNNDFILTASHKFNELLIDGFVGGSVYFTQDEAMENETSGGLSIPGYYSLKASIDPIYYDSYIYRKQSNSLYGRLGISWKNLAFLEGTLRNDWVSTLSKAHRSYIYPSVSGSFVLSELLPKTNWMSFWKLRGSWVTVKTPAGIYDINNVFTINNNYWGTLSTAVYPTTIYGTDVLPQTSSTYEFGTAINLLDNRLSLDIAYYSKRTFDFLQNASISAASGYLYNYVNTDEEITNRGLELTGSVTPVKTADWNWDVGFNWSKYARYYTKIDPNYSEDYPWVKKGKRYDAYAIYDYLRDGSGNMIYSNGLPMYSDYRSKIGYSDPDWIWGLNTSLKYKSWLLKISADGRVGGLSQSITEMYMWRAGSHPNSVVPERYTDAEGGDATFIGKGVKVVSGNVTYDTYGNITSDTRVYAANDIAVPYASYVSRLHKGTAWGGSPSREDVFDNTFFKIREISLTYTLPKDICARFSGNGASISVVAQNVLLWAKRFKYSDPDGNLENFSDPSVRYIGVNLNVKF